MRRSLLMFMTGFLAVVALPALAQNAGYRAFIDVQTDDFFAQDLQKFVDEGILRGYGDGRFGPDDAVTRGQMATILRRYDATNIQPIREQIAIMREELGLGSCGDGRVQKGEQCDDGNMHNGDGCSSYCMEQDAQTSCSGGHRIGESYPSADGCNTCSCTAQGEVCTLRACAPQPEGCEPYQCADGTRVDRCTPDGTVINYFAEPCLTHGGEVETSKCLGDEQCPNGTVCSTRYGDCESACEPGAEACIMACAGRCVQPRDDGQPASCEDLRDDFDDVAAESVSCSRDADCVIFDASCPYVTCGIAVNKNAQGELQEAADAYTRCLENSGAPISCASCIAVEARCVQNRCVTRELR